jgi:uncharacterized membrane protein
MADLGKLLMVAGGSLFLIGLILSMTGRFPWISNLPGDVHLERDGFSIYVPIGTMIVLSLLLTLLLNVIARLLR